MKYQRLIELPNRSCFLLGARGTGKSTWLSERFSGHQFFDLLEERRYQSYLADPGDFADTVRKCPKDQWIIIDEIQRLPNLLNEVHRFIEKDRRKFILCGSSARKLKRAGVNLLAGRASKRVMHPFVPEELVGEFDTERALRFGTLPLVWNADDRKEVLESYVQMYLRDEIQAEAIVRALPAFARFLPVAALFHAQVLSISSLARDAEAHRTTISGYIEILEDTLLAFRLPAFEAKLRVKEKKHPKLYFIDSGIVRALKKNLGPVAAEEKGSLFEGLVANLLRAYRDYRNAFDEWYYWAGSQTKSEVDFVLKKKNNYVAVEVKSSVRTTSQDFRGLNAVGGLKGLRRKILVYMGREKRLTESGIEILPFEAFAKEVEKGLF